MKYVPTVTRIDRGRSHRYVDGEGKAMPGSTSILSGGLPTPALINWSGNSTAEAAVNRWDELTELPPASRLEVLKKARYEVTNKAKGKGTAVHSYAEKLVQGQEVTGIPDELRPYVENYARFIDMCSLDPILVEVVVVSYRFGYAGTLDLVAELTMPAGHRETLLLDVKTGERGVYPEAALQMASYRFADFYVDQDGNEQPMIPVDGCAVIHLTADDAQLIPTVSDREQLNMFRIAQKVYEFQKDSDGLILPAVRWPNSSTAHIVWNHADE